MNLRPFTHGQYISPSYLPAAGSSESPAGNSTDSERVDGKANGIIKKFHKNKSASKGPLTLGFLSRTYTNGIEYGGTSGMFSGFALFSGLGAAAISIYVLDHLFGIIAHSITWIDWLLAPPFIIGLGCGGVYWLLKAVRLELFRPESEPIIFNRQTRKVYRLFEEQQPGFKGLFKRWPLIACEYEWDLIDAEHQGIVSTTGSTVTRQSILMFLVRRSAKSPAIIDSFTIGNPLALTEVVIPGLWEHIRRFMEEGGPHLPPGEALPATDAPRTMWGYLRQSGPLGKNYFKFWKEQLPMMLLIHVLFPVIVPLALSVILLNALCVATAKKVQWPDGVVE